MVEFFIDLVKIVVGFLLLIKGADFFVDGAAAVAKKLGVPQIVIGLTIVAIGTSAPEAAVSISAALKGNNGISIGNVLGSNMMNVLVILGITAVITTISVKKQTTRVDIPFMVACSILLALWGTIGGTLTRVTGVIFILLLVGYLTYLVIYAIKTNAEDEEEAKDIKTWLIPIFIIGGSIAIVIGSNIAVDGASGIASMFGVSDRIIGLTIVALGTSLPELMTSITAARKNNADLAIGNIVGSNLFNILFILGSTTLIIDLPYKAPGVNFVVDGFVTLAASILLWLFTFKDQKLERKNGIIFLIAYLAYFIYIFIN